MMIGWATPTVAPLAGTNVGGPNGAVPVNGVGSCPPAGPATTGTASGSGAGGGTGTSGSAATGAIESTNAQGRKIPKNRGHCPDYDTASKPLNPSTHNNTE